MDSIAVLARDNALRGEHVGMRLRAGYILRGHALVKSDRDINGLHERAWTCGKAATPHFLALFFLALVFLRLCRLAFARGFVYIITHVDIIFLHNR